MSPHRRSVLAFSLLLTLCGVSAAEAQFRVEVDTTSMRLLKHDDVDCSRVLIPVGTRDVIFSCPAAFDSAARAHHLSESPCGTVVPGQYDREREWLAGLDLYGDGNARFAISTVSDSAARHITLVVTTHYGGACGMGWSTFWLGVLRPGRDWTLAIEYRTLPRRRENGNAN